MKKTLLFITLMLLMPMTLVCTRTGAQEKTLVIFEDGLKAGCYTYQNPDLFDIDKDAVKTGCSSLRIGWDVPEGKYPGAGIGMERTSDLTTYRENGTLAFWIKSERDNNRISVGFIDKSCFLTLVSLSEYVDTSTDEWQKVEIPMRDFRNHATRWDDSLGKNVLGVFQWDAVQELALVFGMADGDEHWINIDNVKITLPELQEK